MDCLCGNSRGSSLHITQDRSPEYLSAELGRGSVSHVESKDSRMESCGNQRGTAVDLPRGAVSMITIEGLTARQRAIMDLLWACDTMDQVSLLIQSLPHEQDRMDAQSLITIAALEAHEQEHGLNEYEKAYRDIVDHCR